MVGREKRLELSLEGPLPEPSHCLLTCESCDAVVRYLRVTTPEGLPDFIHPLDDYAWVGWNWSETDRTLSLAATCSRACLVEWWANCTKPGA